MSGQWRKSRTIEQPESRGVDRNDRARPHLFVVLECNRPFAGGARHSLDEIDTILIGRGREPAERHERTLRLSVPDPAMSSTHASIIRALGGWLFRDEGSTNGSFCNGARVTSAKLQDGELLELGGTLFTIRMLKTPPTARPDLRIETDSLAPNSASALGMSTLLPVHEAALASLAEIMTSKVPILLLGESGTGKELLARAAHTLAARSGEFVPVNCGAIPDSLVEGQLFGHARGAFSGAVRDEPGFVRSSDRGTLFLDEIGDLPAASQAALLRVLQESEVLSVGTTRPVKVDLRVVSATHRRIDALSERGFRSDMYARLAGYVHELPPLRERREDLGVLIGAILRALAPDRGERGDLTLSVKVGRALYAHDWPMNVRELRNALSAGLVLGRGVPVLALSHMPEAIRRSGSNEGTPKRDSPPELVKPPAPRSPEDEQLRTSLLSALREHAGNISEVSRAMGRTRMQIHRWLKRFDIDPAEHRKGVVRGTVPKTEPPPGI